MTHAPAPGIHAPPAQVFHASEAQEVLRQVILQAPVGFVQVDPAGRMTAVSPRWCEMLQTSATDLLGRSLQDITHPEDLAKTLAAVQRLAEGGPNFSIEKRYLRRDGSALWACSSVTALRAPDGSYQGLAAIVLDVSDRKRQELELQRMAKDLSDADQRKSEFLATLAHELRNPLAPLSQALHLLRLAPEKAQTVQESTEVMTRQVRHLIRLVDELLDIARIAKGKMALHRDTVALRDVVQSALDLSDPLIRQHRHTLDVALPEAPVYLHADPLRLTQVLANLLNNSAKYTPEGGHIAVNAWTHEQGVTLSVKDNGVGIPSEDLPHIFDMFTQVGRSLEMAQGGLGIGLSLSRQLVEMHGGHIRVHSEGIGRGTLMSVDLPTCPPPGRQRHGESAASPPVPQPLRLLVVDDNTDGANTLAAILQMSGHPTCVAYNGPSAVAQAQHFKPQAAFLDLSMPGMDGFELARELKARQPDLVMVAVTGWAADTDRERSHAAGFDAHLIKPVDMGAIEATLQQIAYLRPPAQD